MRKQRAEQYNQNVLNYTNNIIIWTDTTSQILKRTQKYQPYGVTVNLPVVVGISCQIFFHIFLSKQRLKFLPRIVVTVSGSRFNCKIYSVTLWNILLVSQDIRTCFFAGSNKLLFLQSLCHWILPSKLHHCHDE